MSTGDHKFCGGQPCDGLASHPGRNSNILSHLMPLKLELGACLMGLLARRQTLTIRFGGVQFDISKKTHEVRVN